MSSLLSHKSIRLKKPTHGHQPTAEGEMRPVDTLVDRCQEWKHVTKSLLHYYEGLSHIESHTAKSTLALMETIQVPFHEGHQFLGEGGWQSVLYTVRDNTRTLSDHHAALALTLDKTVVKELEGIRQELKAHILAIEKEAGVLADEVDKERVTSAGHLTQLQSGIDTFENSQTHMMPQHDPFITHTQVSNQLKKQVIKENDFQASLIRFQQQQPSFEAGIASSIQSACRMYDEAYALKKQDIEVIEKQIREALQSVAPDAEYNFYSSTKGAVLDPNSPYRNVDAITFPGSNHASTASIKEGTLERKKRFTKSYKESYYVLTPSGYLHERKSNDDVNDIVPTFSLFLPECSLGPPAKESDKSHKFHVEGNKAVKSSFEGKAKTSFRFGGKEIAYSFRARTHHEMLQWWNEIDKLSRDTKTSLSAAVTEKRVVVDPVQDAVRNVGYAAPAPIVEPIREEHATVIPVESATSGPVLTHHTHEGNLNDDDEEEGGSSAEEEEEEDRILRTAPSTPADGLFEARMNPLDAQTAGAVHTEGEAENLPGYAGGAGVALPAEKQGLFEKGKALFLGPAVPAAGTSGAAGSPTAGTSSPSSPAK